MKEPTKKRIAIDQIAYIIEDVNENFFCGLPEITVDTGDKFVIGTENMFRTAVYEYIDDMRDMELIDFIGEEEIVRLWRCNTTFSDWLSEAEEYFYEVVPSLNGEVLDVDELPEDFVAEETALNFDSSANSECEFYYFDQLVEIIGFKPEIAMLTYENRK